MKIKAPWVVVRENGPCVCTRCGETFHIKLPCRMSVWIAAMRAFVNAHSGCEEQRG